MKAVIIMRNQADSIAQMVSLINIPFVIVLDRCTDNSEELCKSMGIEYLVNSEGEGRQCSRSRNMGANYFKPDDIVFLDGDRLPMFNLAHLESSPFDVTLVKCQEDVRDMFGTGSWFSDPQWGKFHNGVFASCLMIRRTSIDAVVEKYGHLFDEDFTEWGEEDRHLGDLLYSIGATCGYADNRLRVFGRVTDASEKRDEFMRMVSLRIKKILDLGLNDILGGSSISTILGD